MNCLFCTIINKEEKSDVIFENNDVIVIKDIEPKAKVHLLVIPKKHIDSIKEVEEEDRNLMGELILIAKKVAQEKELKGYKLVINVGREGGQVIDHIHLHLLSNS